MESLTGEPQDLDQLEGVLADAKDRGLIDADVLSMLEGVLEVSEIQVRDVMKLTPKGRRIGHELTWRDLVSGQAALSVALNASLDKASE